MKLDEAAAELGLSDADKQKFAAECATLFVSLIESRLMTGGL
jgi:hypothetical protein